MAVAPSNPQIIYVLKGNLISKSTNGGTSFSNITGTLPTNLAFPTNLAVSNTDDKKVWVTFSGYAANEKVYKSIDGGTSWINVSAGLPNIPMNTIAYTNNSPTDAVYLGADIGDIIWTTQRPGYPFLRGSPTTTSTTWKSTTLPQKSGPLPTVGACGKVICS